MKAAGEAQEDPRRRRIVRGVRRPAPSWEHPKTIDGRLYSPNSASERRCSAIERRSKRAVDIALALGCKDIVLWLAREGTYIREAKDPIAGVQRILDAVNALLEHSGEIRILGEMKPNEPMDSAYLPTVGHFLALCYRTADPARSGVLIESAHSILAGIDPSDDMAYALWHGKLWSVHLNDQNGLKYDQDKTFGSVDLRRAFNTVWVLERAGYDGCVGLDVKAMRTTKAADQTKHLVNSRTLFLRLVEVVRSVDTARVEQYRAERDYEGLEMYILEKLMGNERRVQSTRGAGRKPGRHAGGKCSNCLRPRAQGDHYLAHRGRSSSSGGC